MDRELFVGNPVVSTTDFDEATEAVTAVFLPHRLDLLEHDGRLDMRLNALKVGGVTVGYLRYGRDVRVVTADTTNLHIDLPLAGRAWLRCGRMAPVVAGPGQAAVFTPGLPADIRWPADTALLCLMIDRVDVEQELAAMLGRPLTGPLVLEPAMDLTSGAGKAWRDVVDLLVRDAERPDSPLRHPAAARNVRNLMIDTLLLSHANNYLDALIAPAPSPGRQAIREAIDLLQSHPGASWTPAGLAARVSVSLRSLQDGFQRVTGSSPTAYLRELRLARARADLASGTAGSVTEVAGRWGFAHLGRFAAACRQRFGESPSATLRRQQP